MLESVPDVQSSSNDISDNQASLKAALPSLWTEVPTLKLNVPVPAKDEDHSQYPIQSPPARVYNQNLNGLVMVTGHRINSEGKDAPVAGSGFLVPLASGLPEVAVAYHEVKDCRDLKVITADGVSHDAYVDNCNKSSELAVLRVLPVRTNEDFMTLSLSNRVQLNPGEKIVGLGHARGFARNYYSEGLYQGTCTVKDVTGPGQMMEGENQNRTLFSSQIHQEQGNSGGPWLDASGQVVAVVDMVQDVNAMVDIVDEYGQTRKVRKYPVGTVPSGAQATPVSDLIALLNETKKIHGLDNPATNFAVGPQAAPSYYRPSEGSYEWLLAFNHKLESSISI